MISSPAQDSATPERAVSGRKRRASLSIHAGFSIAVAMNIEEHDRHTFLSLVFDCLDGNARELPRHANSQITMDVYTQAASADKRNASQMQIELLLA